MENACRRGVFAGADRQPNRRRVPVAIGGGSPPHRLVCRRHRERLVERTSDSLPRCAIDRYSVGSFLRSFGTRPPALGRSLQAHPLATIRPADAGSSTATRADHRVSFTGTKSHALVVWTQLIPTRLGVRDQTRVSVDRWLVTGGLRHRAIAGSRPAVLMNRRRVAMSGPRRRHASQARSTRL